MLTLMTADLRAAPSGSSAAGRKEDVAASAACQAEHPDRSRAFFVTPRQKGCRL
jgi:hypothetical protein